MFFRELSEELSPGRISLNPVGPAARSFTPCDACGEFSLRRLLASCGHVFCSSCCIIRDGSDGLQLRCFVCRRNSACERNEMKESFLRDIGFACGCGHEGTLTQIRDHLWNNESDHTICENTGDQSSRDQGLADNTPREQSPTEPPPKDATQQSQASRSPREPVVREKAVGVKKEHLVKVIRAELKPLKMVSNRGGWQRAKAYFCFELHKLMDDFVYKRFTQENSTLSWVASEYPSQVYCKITVVADKRYLGVFMKPINDPPSTSSWPMKKKIIIELYNMRGDTVQRKLAATFSNGEPTWDGFVRPYHPKELGGHGFEKFYAIDDLLSNDATIVVNGKVCLSVELQDLQV